LVLDAEPRADSGVMKRRKWQSLVRPGSDRPTMVEGSAHRRYSSAVCMLLNNFDPRVPCDHGCKWVAPFGYVPNARCPRHD
jgi:hypothetical protein